jgi:hypothetical protein
MFYAVFRQHGYLECTFEDEKELVGIRMHLPNGRHPGDAARANVVLIETNDIQEHAFRFRRQLREYVSYFDRSYHAGITTLRSDYAQRPAMASSRRTSALMELARPLAGHAL